MPAEGRGSSQQASPFPFLRFLPGFYVDACKPTFLVPVVTGMEGLNLGFLVFRVFLFSDELVPIFRHVEKVSH